MFLNTQSDWESMMKGTIGCRTVSGGGDIEKKPKQQQQKVPQIEPRPEITNSNYKRPLRIESRPNKRIKIPTKPTYDFLESETQFTSPSNPKQSNQKLTAGKLCSKFSHFLSSVSKDKTTGYILDSKCTFGVRLYTINISENNATGLSGVLTLIHSTNHDFQGKVQLTGLKKVKINQTEYLICKEISN